MMIDCVVESGSPSSRTITGVSLEVPHLDDTHCVPSVQNSGILRYCLSVKTLNGASVRRNRPNALKRLRTLRMGQIPNGIVR